MLRKLYIGTSALFLVGYFSWSAMGWETGWKKRDRVPSTSYRRASRHRRGGGAVFFGRSRRSYYGSSSGWGK